jgi:hypothetical protein
MHWLMLEIWLFKLDVYWIQTKQLYVSLISTNFVCFTCPVVLYFFNVQKFTEYDKAVNINRH